MDNTIYLLAASEVGQRAYEAALEDGPNVPGLSITGRKPDDRFFMAANQLAEDEEALNALTDYLKDAYEAAESVGDDFYETVLRFALQSSAASDLDQATLQSGNAEAYRKIAPWIVLACMMINVEYKNSEFSVQIPNNEIIEKVIDSAELFFSIDKKE